MVVGWVEEDIKVKKSKEKTIKAIEETEKISFEEFEKSFKEYFRVLLESARMHCPVDTGTLRATIRLEDEPEGGGGLGGRIHGEVERHAGFGKRITAGGMLVNPKTGRICDYATFVHEGHFNVLTGNFVEPRPFLDQALRDADNYLVKCADKYLKKIGDRWERD